MKDAADIKPNFGPVYCAMYPELAKIAQSHGYALAIHGSMGRDFDLIAVQWVDIPAEPQKVVDAFCERYAIREVDKPTTRQGRLIYTISIAWGQCAIDLSFINFKS